MSSNIKMAVATRNAQLNAVNTAIGNAGLLKLYSGSQPTDGDTAVGAQVLLATLTLGSPAAGAASAGALTFNAITSDTNAAATGTAAWFRILKSDGTTKVLDGTAAASGADLNLNTTAIVAGATVACTSAVLTGGNA